MAVPAKEIYHGRRPWRTVLIWVLVVVIGLFALSVGLFHGLKRYVVETDQGVELRLPILEQERQQTAADAQK